MKEAPDGVNERERSVTAELAGLDPREGRAPGTPVPDWVRLLEFFHRVEASAAGAGPPGEPSPPSPAPLLREDRPAPPSSREAIMRNTAFARRGFYRVPRVMP